VCRDVAEERVKGRGSRCDLKVRSDQWMLWSAIATHWMVRPHGPKKKSGGIKEKKKSGGIKEKKKEEGRRKEREKQVK